MGNGMTDIKRHENQNTATAVQLREMERELYRPKDSENSGWAIAGRVLKPKEFWVAWGGGGGAVEIIYNNNPAGAVSWCIGAYVGNLIFNGIKELCTYYEERKFMKKNVFRD